MDSGSGRYLDASSIIAGGSTANAGAPSDPDAALELPTVPPRWAYVMLAINLAVYSAGVTIALTAGNEASNEFFLALAKSNDAVVAGEYYRLITATFLHAGVLHLGLNCYALYGLGQEVEAVMGHRVFLTIYLLSGLSGSVASFMLSDATTVGASGAIFGLLGSLAAYFARNQALQNSGRQLLFIALLLGVNLALGAGDDSMIDNTGHVAGFVAGAWLGWTLGPRYIVLRELDIPEGSTDVPGDAREQQVVVDTNTALQRALVTGAFVVSLAVALAAGLAVRG